MGHEVRTRYGTVEGLPGSDPTVRVFRGIPYAAPPVGPLRWRPPQRPGSWTGVRPAHTFGPGCPQVLPVGLLAREVPRDGLELAEDCLYLNVWTPQNAAGAPVLVWVHGGANVTGYGHEAFVDGEAFARRGVILVSFNWRVNIFGWLNHPELSAESSAGVSGNYAIRDQVAALTWVHENIAAFGGDPDRVTVVGESAGASSVQLLSMTPAAEGLFRTAVMQSGGGIDLFSSAMVQRLERAERSTSLELALGVTSIEEARRLPAATIVDRLRDTTLTGYAPLPVADGHLLPGTMRDLALAGRFHDITYVIGTMSDETGMYEPVVDREAFVAEQRAEYGDLADDYLRLCDFLEDDAALAAHLRVRSGELLRAGALGWAEILERHGRRPAYVYRFSRALPGDDLGSYHSGELWYLFGTLARNWRPFTGADHELSTLMTDAWAALASSGDPNGGDRPVWLPWTRATPLTYDLGLRPGLRELPVPPRVAFRRDFVLDRHRPETPVL
ncbi:carboxylesterase/lipase family protein [Cellulomonas hominis]|uniref:carboxylesterase/lipase family protein n=1 Tax=Cellulomonas hominis TaxID=156981 RepID=UPI0027DFBB3D|nr:carboxylesterase family protein [Cellulomonas hominis]